jgi:hypothetical protein
MNTGSAIFFMPGKSLTTGGRTTTSQTHSSLNYQTPAEFAASWRNGKLEGKQTDITNFDRCI